MRWKWLLLLTIISCVSLVRASDDVQSDTENVEMIENGGGDDDDNNNEENYDDDDVQVNNNDNGDGDGDPHEEEVNVSQNPAADVVEEGNEDTVDVDVQHIQEQRTKGKYMNYDDYTGFNLDVSEFAYDWNSK
jgi:hypothetical protein